MNINKTLNEVEKFINDKRTENNKRINMMETLIEKAKAEKNKAEKESKAAFDAMDIDNYHAAQKQIRIASDEVAMYSAKLSELRNAPLMTKEEYDQFAEAILAGLDELNKIESNKLIQLVDEQFIPTGNTVAATIIRANGLLDTMINDFLKLREGTSIYANTRKVYRDYSISGLVNILEESELYKRGVVNE